MMNEYLYTIPSGVIALGLLASMAVSKEIGYRAGLRKGRVGEKEAKDHIHAIQDRLLALGHEAEASAPPDPRWVPFVDAMEELGQTFRSRQAGLERHVPELVLLLLFTTFLLSSAIVGYAAGVVGHRPSVVSYLMVALVVVLVFIILDLDRPRRGFIEVNQKSLVEVQATMGGVAGSPAR